MLEGQTTAIPTAAPLAPGTPIKLPAGAMFALLDRAPFGRLATYAPAAGPGDDAEGRTYVVPLQFLHREGRLYLITRPGRKTANLRAAPQGVCLQLDLAEPAGWTSVCAWGTYREVTDPSERMSTLLGSFQKYPARTVQQGLSMARRRVPGPLGQVSARGDFVIGALDLSSVGGREWLGLTLPPGSALLRPASAGPVAGSRGRPVMLDLPRCLEVLDARPLARVGCRHVARQRCYCVPLWFIRRRHDLWFYHPQPGGALVSALLSHPHGICAQVDSLDCGPAADPAQPWYSVLAEGRMAVLPLGPESALPPEDQEDLLAALRARLGAFGIAPAFVPPDPAAGPPAGLLLRMHIERISGQATA